MNIEIITKFNQLIDNSIVDSNNKFSKIREIARKIIHKDKFEVYSSLNSKEIKYSQLLFFSLSLLFFNIPINLILLYGFNINFLIPTTLIVSSSILFIISVILKKKTVTDKINFYRNIKEVLNEDFKKELLNPVDIKFLEETLDKF